jgi:hypothetical protein
MGDLGRRGGGFEPVVSSVSGCCDFAEDSDFASVTWCSLMHWATTWPCVTWGPPGVLGPL